MGTFFKKKATVLDVATALLEFAPGTEEDAAPILESLSEDVDRKKVLYEIVYLKIFVVDFAISVTLGDNHLKNKVLDAYQVFITEMAKKSITERVNKNETLPVRI